MNNHNQRNLTYTKRVMANVKKGVFSKQTIKFKKLRLHAAATKRHFEIVLRSIGGGSGIMNNGF